MSNATQLLADPTVRTVACTFGDKGPKYTYCTRQELKIDDLVVVWVRDGYKLVRVVEVHDTPKLDTNVEFDYKFVVSTPITILPIGDQ